MRTSDFLEEVENLGYSFKHNAQNTNKRRKEKMIPFKTKVGYVVDLEKVEYVEPWAEIKGYAFMKIGGKKIRIEADEYIEICKILRA